MIAYRKLIDSVTTHYLKLPEAQPGQQSAQELATLPDGRTVVAIFDGHTLPSDQPSSIAASIEVLAQPLDAELKEQIKTASPICKLIADRMVQKIRAQYTIDDEMFFARIGVGAALNLYTPTEAERADMAAFGVFVEEVRQWGRAQRAALGLS